jgi:hypothetical protein
MIDRTVKKGMPAELCCTHDVVDLRSLQMGDGNRRPDTAGDRFQYSVCRGFVVGGSLAA